MQLVNLYLIAFTPAAHEPDALTVDPGEISEFSEHYSDQLEQGYCLFGGFEGGEANVEEVVHTEYPIPWTHSKHRIDFTCVPELVQKSPRLLSEDYNFIGAVHTHPGSQRTVLSAPDAFFLEITSSFQQVHGVSNSTHVQFYKPEDGIESVTTIDFSKKGDEH